MRAALGDAAISLAGPLVELKGGFDTRIIAFGLDGAPPEFSKRLVLRLFSPADGQSRAVREAVVQNTVADLDFPAPRVLLTSNGGLIDDSPFMVMEWVDGRTLMDLFIEGSMDAASVMELLAGTAASLHNLPESALSGALEEAGLDDRSSGPDEWLHGASEWVQIHEVEGLLETIRWVRANRPTDRDESSICHGDLHPLNLLVRPDGTGVLIDWSNSVLADPEFDLGITSTVFAAASAVVPAMGADQLLEMRTGLEAGLLEAYGRRREFSPERVRYYQVLRAARAMAHSAHIRAAGSTGRRSDVYPWERPEVLDALAQSVHRLTGVEARIPGMD